MNKPKVFLLCGLPGSGKSYWAREKEKDGFERITLDEEFFKKYGDNWDKKKHDELEEELKHELIQKTENLLIEGRGVILDYGFWKKKDREKYKEFFSDLADIELVYFDVSKEERFARVLGRDKVNNYDLNLEALETFEKIFEPPDLSELG